MSYVSALTRIGTEHRREIEADLVSARAEYEAAETALESARQRVCLLEGLLQPPEAGSIENEHPTPPDPAGKITLHVAMQKVLRRAPNRKLRAGEIIAEIKRLNLYRMKDGRLPESQQIHARANHYPELFGKDGSYFYAK